jgi:predicted ATPase/DNA-binding CsgD family transcriptional regulator
MDSGDSPPFGAALKRHRLAAGLTHEALAERAGLSARAISDLERGVARAPRPASLRLLADALGLAAEARAALAAAARPATRAGAPAAPERRHDLPAPLSSFVGREREVAAVREALAGARLLTLTGPGGIGKTRLAVEAVGGLDGYPDGVWLVALAPLDDPASVAPTITAALGVRETGPRPPAGTLAAHLRGRRLLLVLDNCEHLLEGVAPLVADLLAAAPGLRVLATSRSPLRITGEREVVVPPLPYPDPRRPTPLAEVVRFPAVRLFAERARSAQSDFAVTEENAAAVADVCARLDGLPLALELAAARSKLLPPAALLDRQDARLPLLTGGPRDAPARHRTLRAALAWSHDLLAPEERELFRRLAVCAGGFDLAAAEAVCAAGDGLEGPPPGAVLDRLATLVDQSLVQRQSGTGGASGAPRLVLLETVREYALECLEASAEAEPVRRAHALHFLELAERAEPALRGAPDQTVWLDQLEGEHDNLREALSWAVGSTAPEGVPLGLRLAGALARFWAVRGHAREGYRWLEALLARSGEAGGAPPPVPVPVRAKALWAAGFLAGLHGGDLAAARSRLEAALAGFRQTDDAWALAETLRHLGGVLGYLSDPTARARLEESLALFEAAGDGWGRAWALKYLADASWRQGEHSLARARLEEALVLFRARQDRRGTAWTLHDLGRVAAHQGDSALERHRNEEALALFQQLGDSDGVASTLADLGDAAAGRGEHRRAAALFRGSLDASRGQGSWQRSLECLAGVAGLAARAGQPVRAARLLGAVAAAYDALGVVERGVGRRAAGPAAAAARAAAGEPAFAAGWARGRALTREQALAEASEVLALARSGLAPPEAGGLPAGDAVDAPGAARGPHHGPPLTPRELEVLRRVAAGESNREIAAELVLSVRTVEKHVARIYGKIAARRRADAAIYAVRQGLLPLAPAPVGAD